MVVIAAFSFFLFATIVNFKFYTEIYGYFISLSNADVEIFHSGWDKPLVLYFVFYANLDFQLHGYGEINRKFPDLFIIFVFKLILKASTKLEGYLGSIDVYVGFFNFYFI